MKGLQTIYNIWSWRSILKEKKSFWLLREGEVSIFASHLLLLKLVINYEMLLQTEVWDACSQENNIYLHFNSSCMAHSYSLSGLSPRTENNLHFHISVFDFIIHHDCNILASNQEAHHNPSYFNNCLAWTIKQILRCCMQNLSKFQQAFRELLLGRN